ncbi:MAG TPA: NAD(P)-dependent alcohol dehydrogenase [Xanthomonadaceae bacterium]|jgi:NADPH:quinone reductase-like Zn-dependent oxidoreductase
MKALLARGYGLADALRCEEIARPSPADDEVLIRVHAASVNPLDWRLKKGSPFFFRLMLGLRAPKDPRCGHDVAGTVEAVGSKVTRFRPGDAVFGACHGAFAEYACAGESRLAAKPENANFEQAAALPVAGLTALQGLRDKGRLRAGQKVLVNGAAGGVGTFAVQIARASDAEVTGVCSFGNADMVRSIGADHVLDYAREDFTRGDRRYDLILDAIGNHSLPALRRALAPGGICALAGARGVWSGVGRALAAPAYSLYGDRKVVAYMGRITSEDLAALAGLVSSGGIVPVIERTYPLAQAAEALRHSEQGHSRGKVIVVP